MDTITVTDTETNTTFNTHYCGVRGFKDVLGYKPALRNGNVQLSHAEVEKLISYQKVIDHRPASEQPATPRQLAYLAVLGVDTRGMSLSKQNASRLIDAAKSGEGVGYLGFSMHDGSN